MKRGLVFGAGVAAAAVTALLAAAEPWHAWRHADADLAARMQGIVPAPISGGQPCVQTGEPPPVVVLALGQSNAGNHGADNLAAAHAGGSTALSLFIGDRCYRVGDPLPGSTGRHFSIWTRVNRLLGSADPAPRVVWAVMGIDATSIDDWTRASSPLRSRLAKLLRDLKTAGLTPSMVLWQQGEADAWLGTSTEDYVRGFEALLSDLREGGVTAPVWMAHSTWCGGADGAAVRQAVDRLAATHPQVRMGPDTDMLQAENRAAGCHFSDRGLNAAAALWLTAVHSALVPH